MYAHIISWYQSRHLGSSSTGRLLLDGAVARRCYRVGRGESCRAKGLRTGYDGIDMEAALGGREERRCAATAKPGHPYWTWWHWAGLASTLSGVNSAVSLWSLWPLWPLWCMLRRALLRRRSHPRRNRSIAVVVVITSIIISHQPHAQHSRRHTCDARSATGLPAPQLLTRYVPSDKTQTCWVFTPSAFACPGRGGVLASSMASPQPISGLKPSKSLDPANAG